MIARELPDGRTILIRQEDHADLSAQFASRWGGVASRPAPFASVVLAATYHDTHFREIEADIAIDGEHGRPFGHRNLPFLPSHLDALRANIAWLTMHAPYAGLLVSMHHTGLPQGRYGVINSWQNGYGKNVSTRSMRPEIATAVRELEADQRSALNKLADQSPLAEQEVRMNYRLMQVFDLLSLYLCCDGYVGHEMKEATLGPIPVAADPDREIELHIVPSGPNTLRLDPYPFDLNPLNVFVPARIMRGLAGQSDDECRSAFLGAERHVLTWTITN